MLKKSSILILFFGVVLLLSSFASADIVVGNSKNWHDLYLSGFYAAHLDADFKFFTSLQDANVKTQTFSSSKKITILESNAVPVVKNYVSFLRAKGFSDIDVIYFDDFTELQNKLANKIGADGVVVLDSRFGLEAVVSSPFMLKNNFAPFFLNEDNLNKVKSDIRRKEEVLVVGYFPVRLVESFEGAKLLDFPEENAHMMTSKFFESDDFSWGIIINAERVDLNVLRNKLPIFVYAGNVPRTAEVVKKSGVRHFEVIGSEMADVAKSIEASSGENLKLLLKYAQTYTNIEGLSGQILELDRVVMPFPFVDLEIVDVVYYPNLNSLAVSFLNRGNLNSRIFSSVEFGANVFSDDYIRTVLPGQVFTIPYSVQSSDSEIATINTLFGFKEPLTRSVASADGRTNLRFDVVVDNRVDYADVDIKDVFFNDDEGVFHVHLVNLGASEIVLVVEVKIDDYTLVSETVSVGANSKDVVFVDAPFVPRGVVVGNEFDFSVYFGEGKIYKVKEFNGLLVKEHKRANLTIIFVVIVVVLLLLLLLLFGRKKKKGFFSKHKKRH